MISSKSNFDEIWVRYLNVFVFSESNIELKEKSIEEKNMTEDLENESEGNFMSKSTKKKEGNISLPVEQILLDEEPIPVGCDESSSVKKR